MDSLEARIQHNEADISTWNDLEYPRSLFDADKSCAFNNFLITFNEEVKKDSRKKIINAGKDLPEIEKKAEEFSLETK